MEGGEITPQQSPLNSVTATPQSGCSFEDSFDDDFTLHSMAGGNLSACFDIEKNEALRELQQMVNRYNECFRMLKDTITTVEMLRLENLQLTAENLELDFLIEEKEREQRGKAAVIGLSPGVRSMRVEEKAEKEIRSGGKNESDLDSPGGSGPGSGSGSGSGLESASGSGSGSGLESASGSGSGSGSGSDGTRGGGVPKSISIRSRGFLAINQPPSGGTHRLRLPASPALYGGDKESGEVEVEVYNQGTAKTELCNKWGEMGWCPYGDRCQFAHGIEELRPVIRHPRYKTQLCRMMGSGGDCPYGHRCHFRHALHTTPK